MIRILLVDDHQVILDGLKAVLEANYAYEVAGTAKNGKYAIKLIEELNPDIVLLDINMPVMDGLSVAQSVSKSNPNVKIIALSMHHEARLVKKIVKSGAQGFLLKNSSVSKIEEAINTVYEGGQYFDPRLMDTMFDINREKHTNTISSTEGLTSRETEIIKLICEEFTGQEIAEKLHISPHTVESHRANIFSKLHIKNIAGLVKWAIKNAVIDI